MGVVDNLSISSFEDVACHYLTFWGAEVEKEREWFGPRCKSLEECIGRACLSEIPAGKGKGLIRHSHQRRIRREVLAEAKLMLMKRISCVERSRSFTELYETVDHAIGAVPGAGPLLVYDVAYRIGSFLSLEAEKVFLHTGTKLGAKAIGLDTKSGAIPVCEFPKGLRNLSAAQLEDVLCIYRDVLAQLHFGTIRRKRRNLRRC